MTRTDTDDNWQPLAKQLAVDLADRGALTDPQWRHLLETTPRHLFVPRYWQLDEYNSPAELVDGAYHSQRQQWLHACYHDQPLVTRWTLLDSQYRSPTSSASAPALVVTMLQLLHLAGGERVLEIGTGTGWSAALLCRRLGEHHVTTIDINPVIAAEAQTNLARLGLHPQVHTGDGRHPPDGPYDRILCTAAAGHIPTTWIDQLTDGGILVAPLTVGGALAVLHKTDPNTLQGRLVSCQAYFMGLHDPDTDAAAALVPKPQPPAAAHISGDTDVPREAWTMPDFRLWLALHLPHTRLADTVDEQTLHRTGVVVYCRDGRASVDYGTGDTSGPWPVRQDRHRLWDSVQAAWSSWQRHGRPARTRLGITADTGGRQWVWLDQPDGSLQLPMPAATAPSRTS